MQRQGAAVIQKEYIYFAGRRVAFRSVPTDTVYYYFSDHLSSANVITNGSGSSIQAESDFFPFGTERVITNSINNRYKFTGKEQDTGNEGGLTHFLFREYTTILGRFVSPDLRAGDTGNPQSLNRYAYVLNNPANLVDPLGLEPPCNSAETCRAYYENLASSYRYNHGDLIPHISNIFSNPFNLLEMGFNASLTPVSVYDCYGSGDDVGCRWTVEWQMSSFFAVMPDFGGGNVSQLRLEPHSDCSFPGEREIVYEVNGPQGSDPGGWYVTMHEEPKWWNPPLAHRPIKPRAGLLTLFGVGRLAIVCKHSLFHVKTQRKTRTPLRHP